MNSSSIISHNPASTAAARTCSVEPVPSSSSNMFQAPLQVTYHQLLQSKSKIEDELFQT